MDGALSAVHMDVPIVVNNGRDPNKKGAACKANNTRPQDKNNKPAKANQNETQEHEA